MQEIILRLSLCCFFAMPLFSTQLMEWPEGFGEQKCIQGLENSSLVANLRLIHQKFENNLSDLKTQTLCLKLSMNQLIVKWELECNRPLGGDAANQLVVIKDILRRISVLADTLHTFKESHHFELSEKVKEMQGLNEMVLILSRAFGSAEGGSSLDEVVTQKLEHFASALVESDPHTSQIKKYMEEINQRNYRLMQNFLGR